MIKQDITINMTTEEENDFSSLAASTSTTDFSALKVAPISDINTDLNGLSDLFPNSPKQFLDLGNGTKPPPSNSNSSKSNQDTDDEEDEDDEDDENDTNIDGASDAALPPSPSIEKSDEIDDIIKKLSPSQNNDDSNSLNEVSGKSSPEIKSEILAKTVEKLKLTIQQLSPSGASSHHSPSSSSSESGSSSLSSTSKKRRRFCLKCNKKFTKSWVFLKHMKEHVQQPIVSVVELDENNKAYQDYLKRQNGSDSPSHGGLKLKLKLSSAQNFEVVSNADQQNNDGNSQIGKIRILSANEIKQSPPRSPRQRQQLPLDAMVALSEMTFNNNNNSNNDPNHPGYLNEQDKMHFECPTLDGLDQYNEDVNKDAAAQLLKQLLENPQMPQENEWSQPNEFISIDRLAHICTVCHSNFPDAVMLYEHKRVTGHDYQNAIHHQQQQHHPQHPHSQQQQQLHQQQMHQQQQQRMYLRPRSQEQMTGYPQQPPISQMQNQIRSFGMRQPGPAYGMQPPGMRPPSMPNFGPPRRTPPPLYRPPNGGPGIPQQSQQPLNMAPFMGMSPDMYNPIPGPNGMNGGNIVVRNEFGQPTQRISPQQRMSPQQRISPMQRMSPLQQQQQQQQMQQQHQQINHPGGPQHPNMMRPQGPMMRPPMRHPQMAVRSPSATAALAVRRAMLPPGIRNNLPNSSMQRPPPQMAFRSRHPSPLQPPMLGPPLKKIKQEDADCELISMQQKSDDLPVIQSVQGGAIPTPSVSNTNTNAANKTNTDQFQLSDQITLSVKGKEQQTNKNPKDVANILANRGITVTQTAKPNESLKEKSDDSPSTSPAISATTSPAPSTNASTTEEAVQKIQLNSSVSIISKKKTINTIDLSNDDDQTEIMPPPRSQPMISCQVKDCNEKFLTQEGLNRHTLRSHRTPGAAGIRIQRCRLCPAKFSSIEGLTFHHKKVHRMKTSPDELGLPIVDLRNDITRQKLASLGIVNYIPLSNLNKTTGGVYGLPIVSVQGAANSAICNLGALGADSLLSLGPVKQIPQIRNPMGM